MTNDLHNAARDGRTAEVISLLDGGVDIEATNSVSSYFSGLWTVVFGLYVTNFLVPFFRVYVHTEISLTTSVP